MFFIFNFQMQWGVQDFHDTKKMLNLKFPDLFLLWYATLQSFRMETGRSVSSKGIATSDLVPWDKTPTLDPKLSFLLVLLLLMMVMMSWVGLRCWCKFPDCLSFHKTPQKKMLFQDSTLYVCNGSFLVHLQRWTLQASRQFCPCGAANVWTLGGGAALEMKRHV